MLPDPAGPGLIPSIPKLVSLINGVGKRKVDSGLKMLIEPIKWQVSARKNSVAAYAYLLVVHENRLKCKVDSLHDPV